MLVSIVLENCSDYAAVIEKLSAGEVFVCEKVDGAWVVNESVKEALLHMFSVCDVSIMYDSHGASCYDKIPLKTAGWSEEDFRAAGFRIVPGAIVRKSAYIAPRCVVMPSFINVGVYVGEGSMIDSFVTVGSCARIGRRCHLSAGVVIAGVLEPVQSRPVIIEDDVFVGANSVISEGVIIPEGCVLAAGSCLTSGSKIFDRESGVEINEIPPYSVLAPGTHNGVACMVLVKLVDAQTRAKTGINEMLRS